MCWHHSESSSLLFELLKMANSSLVHVEDLINYEHVVKPGAPVKKLQLAGGKTYSGNALGQFVDAKLFTFQDLTDMAPSK